MKKSRFKRILPLLLSLVIVAGNLVAMEGIHRLLPTYKNSMVLYDAPKNGTSLTFDDKDPMNLYPWNSFKRNPDALVLDTSNMKFNLKRDIEIFIDSFFPHMNMIYKGYIYYSQSYDMYYIYNMELKPYKQYSKSIFINLAISKSKNMVSFIQSSDTELLQETEYNETVTSSYSALKELADSFNLINETVGLTKRSEITSNSIDKAFNNYLDEFSSFLYSTRHYAEYIEANRQTIDISFKTIPDILNSRYYTLTTYKNNILMTYTYKNTILNMTFDINDQKLISFSIETR